MKFGKSVGLLMVYLSIACASALLIFGSVYAVTYFVKEINYGPMQIGEEKEFVLAKLNTSITDELIIETICYNSSDSIMMKIKNPLGSDIASTNLDIGGNTTINKFNRTLEAGEIKLLIKGVKQGNWNCSLTPYNSSNTQIVFVDNF